MNANSLRDYQMEILIDLTYSRASFFRRHSGIPLHLVRMYLNNETQMINILERLSRPAPPPPLPPRVEPTSFDVPLNLVQLLFGANATVGLGQGQGQNQFWDAVTVGLTAEELDAATRDFTPTPGVNGEVCCVCQEDISTEAAIETLCSGGIVNGASITNHHSLHRRCAQAWFTISTKCPVCRADLRPREPTNTNAAPGSEPAAPSSGVHPNV